MTLRTVAFLFYTHLAGQSLDPILTWPMYAIWLAVGLWDVAQLPRVSGPTVLGVGALMVAMSVGGVDPDWGYRRVFTVLGYGVTYYWLAGRWQLDLSRPLAIASALMSSLVLFGIYLGNINVVAAFIYLTAPASLAWPDWRCWAGLSLGGIALILLGSRGAWLAAIVAGIVYTHRYVLLVGVPSGAWASLWLRPASIVDRGQVYLRAIGDLSLLGRGLGSAVYPTIDGGALHYHAHCLPLTVAVEAGIPGLAALGWGLWRLVPRLGRGWQGATLAGLLAWSLVDEVIWFWGAGLVAVYLMVEVMRDGA